MKPRAVARRRRRPRRKIDKAFGGYDSFKKAFSEAGRHAVRQRLGVARCQSGELQILKTQTPRIRSRRRPDADPTIDVWEHAYYLDTRTSAADYVAAFSIIW